MSVTSWLKTGLEIDWYYGMKKSENYVCIEVSAYHKFDVAQTSSQMS